MVRIKEFIVYEDETNTQLGTIGKYFEPTGKMISLTEMKEIVNKWESLKKLKLLKE